MACQKNNCCPAPSSDALVLWVKLAMMRGEAELSKLPFELMTLEGMSSTKIRHFLNNLCDFEECSYLEVGTHTGSTLLAASYGNAGRFMGIDDFSEFADDDPCAALVENLHTHAPQCCVDFLQRDCWQAARHLPRQSVNVFFYDGQHTESAHCRAFIEFDHCFTDPFIAIVDDWNWRKVRRGTRRAFDELGYSIIREWAKETPGGRNCCRDDWWNGLFVAVVRRAARKCGRTKNPSSRG